MSNFNKCTDCRYCRQTPVNRNLNSPTVPCCRKYPAYEDDPLVATDHTILDRCENYNADGQCELWEEIPASYYLLITVFCIVVIVTVAYALFTLMFPS
jgi:hypothetical protein